MLGDNAESIPEDVREASGTTAFAICSSGSAALSREAAESVARRAGRFLDADGAGPDWRELLSKNIAGAVSSEDALRLATPEGREKIAKAAVRRYYSSPVPPPFSPAEDPFCLKERFLMSLAESPVQIAPLRLGPGTAGDPDALAEFRSVLDSAARDFMSGHPGVEISFCGPPVHTAVAAGKCKREIGILTVFSLLFIAVLSFTVFRSAAWLPLLASTLATAAAAGAAALFAFAPHFHMMSAVFGTTVLGLAVDYSFHWLLQSPGMERKTARNLLVSFATTEISLVPLALSSLPVLRESAVLLAVALAAALALVLFAYPRPADAEPPSPQGRTPCAEGARTDAPLPFAAPCAALTLAAVALAAALAPGVAFRTDAAAVYRPPPDLAKAEKTLAETLGISGDRAGRSGAEIAADIGRLYAEQGARVREALGVDVAELPVARRGSAAAAIDGILESLAAETKRRLCLALAAMALAMAAIFRLRAFRAAAPSLAAFAAAFAAIALCGGSVNLFHLLAGFLLAGMTVDYAVFLHSERRAALKPALCSLATSMAGFGALAFVSFPPVAAFGLVLGTGLPAGFAAAVALAPRGDGRDSAGVEKAASPLGMEIAWVCYRLFGIKALHALADAISTTVWLCSPAVRRASPSREKLRLFARSLADKLAVMSEGPSLPKVRDDGSPDAARFAEDVSARRGVFVLSSHCGTVEVLCALAKEHPKFHAWMDFDRTSVFNAFYMRHAKKRKCEVHPISSLGMGTAFEAGDWLDAGECLVMAGDRGRGAFRFAAAMGHPVYFAACLAERGGVYVAVLRRLPDGAKEMEKAYGEILAGIRHLHPEQDFEWEMA